jgi:hypothetical protein
MKKSLTKIFGQLYFIQVVFFLLILSFSNILANSLIRVGAEVDKSVITIGDRINYTLTIEHDKTLHIEQPGPGANLGQFEIKDYLILDPVEKDNIIIQKFNYEISVFDTGRFVIPPFPVAFFESDTSKKFQIIQSEPIEIFVESVLTAEDAEIKDIKPPIEIPFDYKYWIIVGSIVLLFIAATLFGYYYIRQRRRGILLFKKEVIRPAHEIALEELSKIKENWKDMLLNGEHKLLYTLLSETIRRYFENRYFIKALEETTQEIRISLGEVEIESELKQSAFEILDQADIVKFAKYVPNEEETEKIIFDVEDFVEKTKLIEESEELEIPMEEKEQVILEKNNVENSQDEQNINNK